MKPYEKSKKPIALLTALCVATGCTASAETVKHERVYVVVNHDGEVQTLLDNVHLENGDALDVLSDRSMLKGSKTSAVMKASPWTAKR